jgi:glycosyltransferase involved in cell wall biosynthesis
MTRLVDIITITKDDFQGVCATIKSTHALRQRNEFKQIIVDGSSEETRKQIEAFIINESNIEYIWQKPSGISCAFNRGLTCSKSEWVWFLNGGDEVHSSVEPEKLLFIVKDNTADAIVFQIELMSSNKIMPRPPLWGLWPPIYNWIPHPSTLTRKKLYREHGNFDESFHITMDYEFWFRCLSKNTVVDSVSLKLTRYDETGVSRTQVSDTYKESNRVIRMHYWKLLYLWVYNGIQIFKAWRHYLKLAKQHK